MDKKNKYHTSFLDPTSHEGFIGIYENDTLIATCNTPADARKILMALILLDSENQKKQVVIQKIVPTETKPNSPKEQK